MQAALETSSTMSSVDLDPEAGLGWYLEWFREYVYLEAEEDSQAMKSVEATSSLPDEAACWFNNNVVMGIQFHDQACTLNNVLMLYLASFEKIEIGSLPHVKLDLYVIIPGTLQPRLCQWRLRLRRSSSLI